MGEVGAAEVGQWKIQEGVAAMHWHVRVVTQTLFLPHPELGFLKKGQGS